MRNWLNTRARQLRDDAWHAEVFEVGQYIPEDGSDCGGWTWDPPCGGCDRCCWDQALYYFEQEHPWPYWVRKARHEVVALAVVALVSAAVAIVAGVAL